MTICSAVAFYTYCEINDSFSFLKGFITTLLAFLSICLNRYHFDLIFSSLKMNQIQIITYKFGLLDQRLHIFLDLFCSIVDDEELIYLSFKD